MSDDTDSQYPIDPLLNQAVQQVESNNDPNAVSPKGAVGSMQTMPSTLTKPGYGVTPAKNNSAAEKQRVGTDYLQAMHNKYQDSNLALAAYNWGPTNVDNWIANGSKPADMPAETKNYVQNVNAIHQQLQAQQLPAGTQVASNDDGSYGMADSGHQPLKITIPNIHGNPSLGDQLRAAASANPEKTPAPSTMSLGDQLRAAAANNDNTTQSPTQNQAKPTISTAEDLALTAPSSVVKGIGAIPQFLGMGVNAVANTMGEAAYGINRAMGAPKNDALYNRLTNINPIMTGNTPLDALYQAGANIGTTGNNVPPNPLTGSVLHDPQTMPGRFENALIMAAVAGKGAGGVGNVPEIGLPAALAGGAGAQTASEIAPGSPSAQLLGGGLGYKVGKEFTPNPLQSDVATEVVNAKNEFNMNTPTAAISKNNWAEKLAAPADAKDVESGTNKAIVDMIGANDNGEGHTVLNPKSYLAAENNNVAAYDNVFKGIGDVPINSHIVPIMEASEKIGTPTFNDILKDIQSKQNPNGTLPASAIKELIKVGKNGKASVLQQLASNATDRPSAIAAGTIIDHLESALKDAATPEQYAQLKAIDTRYKTMKTMEPIARQVGAGSQATVPAVQNALNTSFPNITKNPVAPVRFSNYLNTINPGAKSSSVLPGIKETPTTQNALLPTAENVAAIASGHPWLAAAPIVQKGFGIAAGKAASKYTNMDWYKNRLLENAQ